MILDVLFERKETSQKNDILIVETIPTLPLLSLKKTDIS